MLRAFEASKKLSLSLSLSLSLISCLAQNGASLYSVHAGVVVSVCRVWRRAHMQTTRSGRRVQLQITHTAPNESLINLILRHAVCPCRTVAAAATGGDQNITGMCVVFIVFVCLVGWCFESKYCSGGSASRKVQP